MRAVLFHGVGDLRVEEVPDPVPGPGDVLVQVEVALTDGTDLKTYRQGHPVLLSQVPSPFGHEFCGIDVATGRRVVAANSGPCGTCAACVRGDEPLCDSLLPFLNGAYAELLVVPERIARTNLLPVPDGLAPEIAALVEPLACCIRGVERAGIQEGQTVAVLGAGPIGLMLCACIADAGAHAGARRRPPGAARARARVRRRPRQRTQRRRRDRGDRHPRRAGATRSRSSVPAAPPSSSAGSRDRARSRSTRTGSTTRS